MKTMNPTIDELNRVLVLCGGQPIDAEKIELDLLCEKVKKELENPVDNRYEE